MYLKSSDLTSLGFFSLSWQVIENEVWLYMDWNKIYPACRTSSNENHLSGWLLLNYDPVLLLVSGLPRVPCLSPLGIPWLVVSSVFLGGVITLMVCPCGRVATLVGGVWRDCSITTCQGKLIHYLLHFEKSISSIQSQIHGSKFFCT